MEYGVGVLFMVSPAPPRPMTKKPTKNNILQNDFVIYAWFYKNNSAPCYVGRWDRRDYYNTRSRKKLHKAIKKLGKENFKMVILRKYPYSKFEEVCEKEAEIIKFWKSRGGCQYNTNINANNAPSWRYSRRNPNTNCNNRADCDEWFDTYLPINSPIHRQISTRNIEPVWRDENRVEKKVESNPIHLKIVDGKDVNGKDKIFIRSPYYDYTIRNLPVYDCILRDIPKPIEDEVEEEIEHKEEKTDWFYMLRHDYNPRPPKEDVWLEMISERFHKHYSELTGLEM